MAALTLENPRIRPLDVFPVQISGKEMIGLRDRTGISPEVVFVPPQAFLLISLMDGENSLRDLQAAYMRKYGELLFIERIEELIKQLDAHYLLENRRFSDYFHHLKEEFKETNIRKAAFAGNGYEEDAERLKAQLRDCFMAREGPGLPDEGNKKREVRGIVAPHIDFARGGTCYAYAYKTLAECTAGDLYVILGTCHTPMKNPLAFTLKTFETPLGNVEVDREVVEEVTRHLPYDPLEDEFAHRNEHTIEFQVLFLQYILKERAFKIFPILCNSFQEMIQKGISPLEDDLYSTSITTLKETLSSVPNLCLIASADLAHVGPQFGDTHMVTPGTLAEIKAKDLEMLGYVEQLNGEELYRFILRERDKRNICGLPPLYALLHLKRAQLGELLNYQQWYDSQGRGTVTFASMSFT